MAYERITRYAGKLAKDSGRLTEMTEVDGVLELPRYFPSDLMKSFQQDFYDGGFADHDYFATLEQAGLDMGEARNKDDLTGYDAPTLLAALTFCIRSERFGEGNLYQRATSGILDSCLAQLKEIDEKAAPRS